jgi:hypothetical protein
MKHSPIISTTWKKALVRCGMVMVMFVLGSEMQEFQVENRLARPVWEALVSADASHIYGASFHPGKPSGAMPKAVSSIYFLARYLTLAPDNCLSAQPRNNPKASNTSHPGIYKGDVQWLEIPSPG